MNTPVAVRPAMPADLPALGDLLRELFRLEEDFAFDADRVRAGLDAMLANPSGRLFVAEAPSAAGREVVGLCSGQLTVSTAEGGPAVLVEDVVVREDWRGAGVGSRLMDALACWAADNRARRLQLLADRGNAPALEFYERRGWLPTNLVCLRRILPQGA